MALNAILRAIQRGGTLDGQEQGLQVDQGKNLLTASGALPYGEMARAGGIWNVLSGAFTPVAAVPTTTAALEIYNNTNSGMVMEIIDLFAFHLLGTTVLHSVAIWAMVTAPKAAPSTGSLVISSQSGRGKYTDTATTRVTSGAGTTVVANGWRPFGANGSGVVSTATPNEAYAAPVNGQLVVPPGCSLCVTATDAVATASSVQVGATWFERASATIVGV